MKGEEQAGLKNQAKSGLLGFNDFQIDGLAFLNSILIKSCYALGRGMICPYVFMHILSP